MKLGAVLKNYREENGLSLRDFAKKSGVSNSYLSMLETGRQPQSGRPIVPTLTTLNKLAAAMCMRVDDLIAIVDDMPVSIKEDTAPAAVSFDLSPLECDLITRFRALPDGEKNFVLRSLGLPELSGKEKDGSIAQNAG